MTGHTQFAARPPMEGCGRLSDPQYVFPCSPGQQALWYLDRLNPGNPAWNIAVRFRISGLLDLVTLRRAINCIVERHEVLRTTFTVIDAEPMQLIHDSAQIPVLLDDLGALNRADRDAEEERLTVDEAARRFDLKSGPLLRARLLALAPAEHVLLVTIHHIVSDGWSIGIFSDELAAFYSAIRDGAPAPLPPLPLQYADFAAWQAGLSGGSSLDGDRAYWNKQLANLPACEIPPDFSRPARSAQLGYILSELLPPELTLELAALARANNCTLFEVCLAALQMLIAHHARQQDICVGSLLAGRDRAELDPLIGLFINTVILRTALSGDPTFRELLTRVRSTCEQALSHGKLHFQEVIRQLNASRRSDRRLPYSVNFIYQRDFVRPREFSGLSLMPIPSKSPGAIYDLNFFMVRRSDGWRLSCEYDRELYAPKTVARLLGQLRELFNQAVRDPGQRLPVFTFPEDAGAPLPPFVPEAPVSVMSTGTSAGARSK